jgi:hypothetical protein
MSETPDKSSLVGRVSSRGEYVVPPPNAASGDAACNSARPTNIGRVPPPAGPSRPHEFTRISRSWYWQDGFHDHKFRTPESEARKWEYVCFNPVRYRLVQRPEDWPYGGAGTPVSSGR